MGRKNMQANAEQEGIYRSMMAPLIQKSATPGEVLQAAAEIEDYAKEHAWFKQRVTRAASLIVGGGRLENYGTKEAQEYLKQWAANSDG